MACSYTEIARSCTEMARSCTEMARSYTEMARSYTEMARSCTEMARSCTEMARCSIVLSILAPLVKSVVGRDLALDSYFVRNANKLIVVLLRKGYYCYTNNLFLQKCFSLLKIFI